MALIPADFISRVVDSNDIYDVISSYVRLKRAGRLSKGLCPFHSEKTPSFCVYSDTQSFYCFGCGVGGDVVTFVKQAENLDYVAAIHFLAKRAGLTVPEGTDDAESKQKALIYKINRDTARFYHLCLKSQAGKAGYEYLTNRGLSDAVITAYGLGFAPNDFSSLLTFLTQKGYTKEQLYAAAVVGKSQNDHYYDYFRNRVMFPIIDLKGNVIAFGGRVMDDSKPKYLNSPDTPVFKKSRNLFSLNLAKKGNVDTLILAEGYMDVIAVYAAGFTNVVATLGTALTAEQARLMAKYAKQVVIAYDADEAGQKAVHRALNLFTEVGLPTRILKMEGAKDPDEYIRKFGVVRFARILNDSSDVVEFELSKLKNELDLKTAEGKIDYVRRAVRILSEIESPIARDIYASQISEQVQAQKQMVLAQIQAVAQKQRQTQSRRVWNATIAPRQTGKAVNPEKREHAAQAAAEEKIIAYLLRMPQNAKAVFTRCKPELFVTAFDRKVYQLLWDAKEQGLPIQISVLQNDLTAEELAAVAGMLAQAGETAMPEQEVKDCIRILSLAAQKPPDEQQSQEARLEYREKLRQQKHADQRKNKQD